MKKIAIVGAGGVGSYLIQFLFQRRNSQQLYECEFHIFDGDIVEEKNLAYQNFKDNDVTLPKAMALSMTFEDEERFHYHPERVESWEQLSEFDLIVNCADSNQFRKLLYANFKDTDWIELRSEANLFAAFKSGKGMTKEKMESSLPKEGTEGNTNGSCQHPAMLNEGRIMQGNLIIASLGSQYVMNWAEGRHDKGKRTLVGFA